MVTKETKSKVKKVKADIETSHISTANASNLPISTKQSVEICNFLRFRNLQKAKRILTDAMNKKIAIPYKRYYMDTGHKPGIAAGRYPYKASFEILKLLNSAEANAENKGLDTEKLVISKMIANKGNRMYHTGRHRGIKMKRTHIELTLEEQQINKNPILKK